MSFSWINKQGVEHSDGYILQRVSRYAYHYMEGSKVLEVGVEPGLRSEEIILDQNPSWQPPNESEEISEEDLKEIESRIAAALKFKGIGCQIVRE